MKAELWIAYGPEIATPAGPVNVVQDSSEEIVGGYTHKGY
jgi:hypothetical protein